MSLTTTELTLERDSLEADVRRIIDSRMAAWLSRTETTDETVERVTEEFDTTQPADSVTGQPPLKSRTTERAVRQGRSDTKGAAASEANEEVSAVVNAGTVSESTKTAEADADSSREDESTTKEERKSGGVPLIAGILAGIIATGFMAWLLITVVRAITRFIKNH